MGVDVGDGVGSDELEGAGDDGSGAGVASLEVVAEPVGLGDADAVTGGEVVVPDAVGLGSGVVSASALVAGPPTRAAARSRVPERRSRAPRAVVGVDIGAFPERSVT